MQRAIKFYPLIGAMALVMLSGCFDTGTGGNQTQNPSQSDTTLSGDKGGPPNKPPTISGKPDTAVKIGESYAFQPTARDPNGDPLTFRIRNKPTWTVFDPGTGRLSGIPDSGDVGSYTGIEISVSDGKDEATLQAFAIDVTQIGLGSVTLSWMPPTENTDGTPLTDLSGYRIYFGKTQQPDQTIEITSPGITSYVIENLSPATYYFAMSAVNSSGVESERSQILSKTIS